METNAASDARILWRLLKLFRPYWGWMALGSLLSLITVFSNIGLLALSGWFITAMAIAGVAGAHMNYFTPAAIIRGLAMMRTASRYGERVITHEATFRLLATLRRWFYEHLEPLAPAGLQGLQSGDLLSRIRADIDTLQNTYLRIFLPVFSGLIAITAVCLFLVGYSRSIALLEACFALLAGVITPVIMLRLSQKPGKRMVETASSLRIAAIDSLQGMGELAVYQATEQQTNKFSLLSESLLNDQQTMAKYSGISQGAVGLFANLTLLGTLLIAIPLVNMQQLQAAELPMLALLTLASFEALLPLPLAFQLLPETLHAARRIFAIADQPSPVSEPVSDSPSPQNFDIRLEDVTFHYPGKPQAVLQALNLTVPQGQTIALVGPSGEGKSTLVNLLLKFHEPQQGVIRLGGYPLSEYHGEDLRSYFAVASQHTHLFNSTVRGNLLLAKPDASDEELEQVCRLAQIHEFIVSQPGGYGTWVGEAGLKLSGGQTRRLAIARALLKDAPILILDEPGEGLDPETESRLMETVLASQKGKTVILITHGKAGLHSMDQRYHLSQGQPHPF